MNELQPVMREPKSWFDRRLEGIVNVIRMRGITSH